MKCRLISPMEHYIKNEDGTHVHVKQGEDFECSREYLELQNLKYHKEYGLVWGVEVKESGEIVPPDLPVKPDVSETDTTEADDATDDAGDAGDTEQ